MPHDTIEDRHPLHLEELDPSPVEEDAPFAASNQDYFPMQDSTTTAQKPSQRDGLAGHSAPWWLLRAHRYSSYTFTAFLALHITNTSLIPLATRSIPASTPYLLLTRPYYQSWPLAEPLLVISPLFIHIASGVALRLHRRHVLLKRFGAETPADRRRVSWPRLSVTSALGYAALPLMAGHVAINRFLPVIVEGGSSGVGLDFVGHGVALHRVFGFAGFTALVGVVGAHVVWGWGKWLGWSPEQVAQGGVVGTMKRRRRWWVLNGVSSAVVVMWLAGGLGIVARGGRVGGWVGRGYDEMYRRPPLLRTLV